MAIGKRDFRLGMRGYIPSELSSKDSFASMESLEPNYLLPQTNIESIVGGENLGTLLFAFILHQGFSEAVLPLIAKVLSVESQQWYLDYKENFSFETPPLVELFRVLIFVFIGFYVDKMWIFLLGGDPFWGWATAGALSIPVALFAYAKDKKPSRSLYESREKMKADFKDFASKRVSINMEGEECTEIRIINIFRRNFPQYRDESVTTEKELKMAIRSILGKPKNGIYKGVAIIGKSQRQAMAEAKQKIKELQEQAKELKEQMKAEDNSDAFVNEFTRT